MRNYKLILFVFMAAFLSSCRGQPFEEPPIYIQYNMYWQEKFEAQEVNPLFADNRSDRLPPEGTVSRGNLQMDTEYHFGVDENGDFIENNPVELSRSFLKRGQERFEIYCTPCHGALGEGGVTGNFGLMPISLQSDAVRNYPDGQIYNAIYNGIRTMPSYRYQVAVDDRWAIVAYVRALQRSQHATEQDLRTLNIDVNTLTAD
ncbi:MAG: cytochrome c [Balneolales bacterium]